MAIKYFLNASIKKLLKYSSVGSYELLKEFMFKYFKLNISIFFCVYVKFCQPQILPLFFFLLLSQLFLISVAQIFQI